MPYEDQSSEGRPWLRTNPHCSLAAERLQAIGQTLSITSRELQIIQGLFDGKREETIARDLGISRHTVHTHLGRVYKKLNVDCCAGLFLRIFNEYIALESVVADPAVMSHAESHPLRLRGGKN